MPSAYYRGPDGSRLPIPLAEATRELFLDPKSLYWQQGSGTATVRHGSGNALIIGSNRELGFYLQLVPADRRGPGDKWLSLHDPSRLEETVDAADEWYASVGLFLPGEDAWKAIEEFSRTGQPSLQVRWIRPEDMPEKGNW